MASTATRAKNNKTLVILIGTLRCGEPAWQTLYQNVLDVNSADLALMLGDSIPQYQNASLLRRAKYTWRFQEYDDWADALDLINGTAWRDTVLPRLSKRAIKEGALGGIKGIPNSSGAIQTMIKYWLAGHIRQEKLTEIYDRFVITRTDQYYMCPYDLSPLDNQYMWVPRGEDFEGICDRHLVCNSKDVLEALDILPPFLNDYDQEIYGKVVNPESLLKAAWDRKNLRALRFRRLMFTCRAGDMDPKRGGQSGKPLPGVNGTFVKYWNEYTASLRSCSMVNEGI
jgi:hypothetical protein